MPSFSLQLVEPLIDAMVTLLSSNLNPEITTVNTAYNDGIVVPQVAQFLNYSPVASTLTAGLPIVGVQELPGEFQDDTQFSLNALHRYTVVAFLTNVDHHQLAVQLRRMVQAIANVIQADRLQGTVTGAGGVMRTQGGALSVNFMETYPGPMLGDVDPTRPEVPPTSYVSWAGITLESIRVEV